MTKTSCKTLVVASLALLAGCMTLDPSPALLAARSGYASMAGSTNAANAEARVRASFARQG